MSKLVSYLAGYECFTYILVYISDFLDVICSTVTYVNNTSLCCNCDMAGYLWQQFQLISETKSYLQGTEAWLVSFNVGKT